MEHANIVFNPEEYKMMNVATNWVIDTDQSNKVRYVGELSQRRNWTCWLVVGIEDHPRMIKVSYYDL